MNKNKFVINKTYILLFLIIILTSIIVKLYILVNENNFNIKTTYKPNNDPEIVRIYYDIATWPTLYEVEDFLNQSPNTPVFIAWDRIPNIEDKLKKYKNVHFIKHIDNYSLNKVETNSINEYYKKHPNSKYIIHTSNIWFKNLFPALINIPTKQIEEIHVYEDGSHFYTIEPEDSTRLIESNVILHDYLGGVTKIFHFDDADMLNATQCIFSKRCLMLKKLFKDDIVVKTTTDTLKDKLKIDSAKKEEFFRIFNFDYHKYQQEMTHPFGIYLYTVCYDIEDAISQIFFMREFLYGNLAYLIKDKKTKWFYKPHPEKRQAIFVEDILKKENPELHYLESKIPLELFIIADITPDYIAGFSSGTFLSFSKQNIISFIRTENPTNLDILRREGKIGNGRTFYITDYDYSLKSRFKRLISRILVFFDRI